jgi:PKD repeat protein
VIHPDPIPNFTHNPGFGNPPVTVNFTNTSTGALSYIWDFDDGTQSTLANPSHNYLTSDNYQISLTARNNFGCEKTIVKTFDVFDQYLDVAILDITTSLQNNFLSITAKIANTGNTDVTDMEFYIKVKNGPALKENWSGLLQASSIISYKLSSSAYIENEKDYVCVSVLKPNGMDDQVSSNNELCKALDESEFKVLDIYPNPSTDILTLPFIIPAAEKMLTVTIYNVNGDIVKNAFSGYLSNGLQMLVINTVELTSGLYACKIEYENQTVIKTFIKH